MRRLTLLFVAAVLLLPPRAFAQAESYRVVVNPNNPTTSLTRAEVSRLFLKKTGKWSSGATVVPVDQARESETRKAFSLAIHDKDVDQISSYWQVLVFSGRDVPPKTFKSDAEVLQFVRDNIGAVGYVSVDASLSGVKAIAVRP